MRIGVWLGAVLGWGLPWVNSGAVRAETALDETSPATPSRVDAVMVGGSSMPSFAQRLQSWFQDHTRVSVAHESALNPTQILSSEPTNAVRVWIDLTTLNVARVYFVTSEQGANRWLLRDVPLENGADELGQERLAQVVFSSTQAIWEGSAASTRTEIEQSLTSRRNAMHETQTTAHGTPPARPRPVPGVRASVQSTSPPPRLGVSLRASYAGMVRGGEGLAHGPELSLFLSQRREQPRFSAFVTTGYIVPTNTQHADFTLRLTGGRVKAGAAWGQRFDGGIGYEIGAAIGAEFIQYQSLDAAAGLAAQPSTGEMRPVTSLHMGVTAPGTHTRLALAFVTDIRLDRTSYVIQRRGTTDEAFAPWPLQPGLVLSLVYDFAHE